MGKVYKVFDTKIKDKVALKLIKPEIAFDEEIIERFNNELRLARKIRHKNVCGMYDYNLSLSCPYFDKYIENRKWTVRVELIGAALLVVVFLRAIAAAGVV